MEFFSKKIIIISILIIVSSLFDLLDNTIISIFNLEDEGTFALIVDFISPILEVSLMFWALLTGKKIIYQIRDEEEQYKRLVQLSPESIIIHNKGRILYINESGANLFGSSSTSELINRNLSEFVHHDSKDLSKKINEHLEKFSNSELNEQVKIKRVDGALIDLEFKSTKIDFKGQSAREMIARDITIQKSEIENVKRLAYQDALTGLPNRRAFMDQFVQLLKSSENNNAKFGVMFIDLDGFKQVNDSLGHEGGDILLKQVSDYFKKCVAEKGIVARLAGDEFIVLLHNVSHNEYMMVAKEMIESLSSPIIIYGKRVRVTPSIGIALYPQHGHEATELIKNADIAMYQAKQHGKNNYQIFEPHTRSNSIV
ncbi:sensor domain-containing diguanylate cyclase [Bacillus sp. OK048]|uniref:sensor domain-containing diguanylate cyclase n=1 Tax=Bacillus sp. OK048 TaxID=1882761 RepID=UPI000882C38F|nr:sensor domain-containing diguanylate cyclase [Bacillus sp. OK048]SDN59552.1 PAS domain S-box-containing protein/diguanylate cyclase (GGDEF) domain-containing protein [Bacillus sp. OK048]